MILFTIIFLGTISFVDALNHLDQVQEFLDAPGSSPYPGLRHLSDAASPSSSNIDMSAILKDFSVIKAKQQAAYLGNIKSNGVADYRPSLFLNYSSEKRYIAWFESAKKEREINLSNFLNNEMAKKADELRKSVNIDFARAAEDKSQDYNGEHIPDGNVWKSMGLWFAQKFLKDLGFAIRNDKTKFSIAIKERISRFLDLEDEKSIKIVQYKEISKRIDRYLQQLRAPDMGHVYSDFLYQSKKQASIRSKKITVLMKYEDAEVPLSNFLLRYSIYKEYCAQMDLALALYKNISFINESLAWLYGQCRERGYALTRRLYMDVNTACRLPSTTPEKYAKWKFDKLMRGIAHVDEVKYLDAFTFLNVISLSNDEKAPYYSMLNEFPLSPNDLDNLILNFLNKGNSGRLEGRVNLEEGTQAPGGRVTFSSEILKNEIAEILYQNCQKYKVWHDLLICLTCWLEYDYKKTPDIPLIYTPLTDSHMSLHFYGVLSNPSGLAVTLKPSLNGNKINSHPFDLSGKNRTFPAPAVALQNSKRGGNLYERSSTAKPILKTPKGSGLLSHNTSKKSTREGLIFSSSSATAAECMLKRDRSPRIYSHQKGFDAKKASNEKEDVSSKTAIAGILDSGNALSELQKDASSRNSLIPFKVNVKNLLIDPALKKADVTELQSPSHKMTFSQDCSESGIFKSSQNASKKQAVERTSSILLPNVNSPEQLLKDKKSDTQVRSYELASYASDTFSRFTYDSEGNANYRKDGFEIMSGGCPKFDPNSMSIPISYDPQFYFSNFKAPTDKRRSVAGLYVNSLSLRHVVFHLLKHTFLDAFVDSLFKTGEDLTSKLISRIYSLECDKDILKSALPNPNLKLGQFLQDLQKILPKERRKKFSRKEIEDFRGDPELFTTQVRKIFYDEKFNIMFANTFDIFNIFGIALVKTSGRNVLIVNEFCDNALLARERKPIIYSKFNIDPIFLQDPMFSAFSFGINSKAMQAILGLLSVDYMSYSRKMKYPWLGCVF